jgi:hypothetical protein
VWLWAAQIPVAVLTPLKSSIAYLVFLSLAALVESASTDWDQARQAEKAGDAAGDLDGRTVGPMTQDTSTSPAGDLEDVDDAEDSPEQVETTGPAAASDAESQDPEVTGDGGDADAPEGGNDAPDHSDEEEVDGP